jgi:hypothetical protein
MKAFIPTLLLATVLVGCTNQSPIVMVAPNEFMLSRSEKGYTKTGEGVKANAIKKAQDYCEASGQLLKVDSAMGQDMKLFIADAQATVKFKCVSK